MNSHTNSERVVLEILSFFWHILFKPIHKTETQIAICWGCLHNCIYVTVPKAAPSNSSSLKIHLGGHSEQPEVVHVDPLKSIYSRKTSDHNNFTNLQKTQIKILACQVQCAIKTISSNWKGTKLGPGATFASNVCLYGGHKAPHYHPTSEISGKLILRQTTNKPSAPFLNKVKEVNPVTAS